MSKRPTAIVTGASAGVGRAVARTSFLRSLPRTGRELAASAAAAVRERL